MEVSNIYGRIQTTSLGTAQEQREECAADRTGSGHGSENQNTFTPGLLVKWRDRYQVISKEAEQAHLELSDMEAARREIKRLERRLAEVEEEREILKKTINIFSRKSE